MKRRDSDLLFGIALFAIALLPRLWVASRWAAEPVWDAQYYDFGARRIAAGFGYSDDRVVDGRAIWHPWCHYPVGYSGALGLVYRLFGADMTVAHAFDASVGALLAVVTWAVARRAMSEARARGAGAIIALHPGLILYGALLMTEPLAALLMMSAFYLAVRDARTRGLVLGALALGVAALVRPQALLCAPFLPLASRPASIARSIALACLLALAPVLPWTARNCAVMDGCALVSTNAGWNLAIGAFPRATGRFETLRAEDGCREVTGQVQQDRCWLGVGARAIARDPVRWLGLAVPKLGYTFDHESFAVEYLHQARPSEWPEEKRAGARDLLSAVHRALLAFAAFGCVGFTTRGRGARVQAALWMIALALVWFGARADAPTFWPLALFSCVVPWLPLPGAPPRRAALLLPISLLATTALTHAIFFGEDRYHVVTIPALAILAAGVLRRPARVGTQ